MGNPLRCVVALYVGVWSEREQCRLLGSHPTFKRVAASPAATTPTGFYSQMFWGFILPTLKHWVTCLSHYPVVPPGSSTHECGTTRSASHCLAVHPFLADCPSLPLLPVRMNVSSLTPWLSDKLTIPFSGSYSCCFCLFLNWLFPTFGLMRRQSISTYISILAGTPKFHFFEDRNWFHSFQPCYIFNWPRLYLQT